MGVIAQFSLGRCEYGQYEYNWRNETRSVD
jgi:hypothetical protein